MPFELLLTLVAVFTSVGLISWTLVSLTLSRSAPERRGLKAAARSAAPQRTLDKTTLNAASSTITKYISAMVPVSPHELSRLQRRLGKAGYQGMTPALVFWVGQFVCLVTFAGLALWFLPGDTQSWILAMIAAAIGYLLPSLVLDYKVSQRKKMIANGLPDALDLFVVCLEAGSSLDQAILKAGNELEITYPALAQELRLLILETRAGKPRVEAFKNLAARTGVDDVRALVTMLVQTDKFGTSLADALRTQAAYARTMRRQRAEERAQKIGVKLVFPLVFMLFPAFYVVILGPAVIQFIRVFFGQMGAGTL
jgi:tight adherence protein C